MIVQIKKDKLLYWSFLSLFIYEFLLGFPNLGISSSNFFILLYVSIACLLVLYFKNNWKQEIPNSAVLGLNLLLACNLIAILRGILKSAGYLDWKNIFVDSDGGVSLLIPLAMMSGIYFVNSKKIIRLCITIFKYSIILIPLALYTQNEFYPRIVIPVILFILFLPYFNKNDQYIILLVGAISAGIALSWRANVLHIILSFSFLLIFYLRRWISKFHLVFAQLCLLIVPLYFLNQGINGDSIFSKLENEYTIVSKGEEIELTADTRTGLYEEVLSDLYTTGNLWFGKGSIGKYKTEYDYNLLSEMGDQRPSIEVGFLKILMHTGIIGMILYSLILFTAVYYGTRQTNNTLTKLLALLLASHWAMLFIEESTVYSMFFYLSWFATGLCFSKQFRSLTDQEIKDWIRFGK